MVLFYCTIYLFLKVLRAVDFLYQLVDSALIKKTTGQYSILMYETTFKVNVLLGKMTGQGQYSGQLNSQGRCLQRTN